MVRMVQPISFAAGVLAPGDIIMRFDGVQVANDGTVPFRSNERIAFSECIECTCMRGTGVGTVQAPSLEGLGLAEQ